MFSPTLKQAQICTPALACGVLPGIVRAQVLALAGRLDEARAGLVAARTRYPGDAVWAQVAAQLQVDPDQGLAADEVLLRELRPGRRRRVRRDRMRRSAYS